MLFFKRILKKEEPAKEVAREERRGGQRYAVNPKFPLKAVLSFNGRDEEGNLLSSQRARWDWKGSLFNFSERGARMQMAPETGAISRN